MRPSPATRSQSSRADDRSPRTAVQLPNSGTKGGLRVPFTAVSLRRRQRLTPATIGARSTTRVSLTTTAAASADGPTTEAVATVCATSCTLAPVHRPNSTSDNPRGCCSSGSTEPAQGNTDVASHHSHHHRDGQRADRREPPIDHEREGHRSGCRDQSRSDSVPDSVGSQTQVWPPHGTISDPPGVQRAHRWFRTTSSESSPG